MSEPARGNDWNGASDKPCGNELECVSETYSGNDRGLASDMWNPDYLRDTMNEQQAAQKIKQFIDERVDLIRTVESDLAEAAVYLRRAKTEYQAMDIVPGAVSLSTAAVHLNIAADRIRKLSQRAIPHAETM